MPRPRINPDEKRREILATAERLIDQYGQHKVTMQDISAAHGMSQSNIYRFFANKDELLVSLADQWFDEIESALEQVMKSGRTPTDKFNTFIRTQFAMKRDRYDQNPSLFNKYLNLAANNPESIKKHVSKLQRWLRLLVKQCWQTEDARRHTVELIEDMTIKFRDPHLISAHRNECTNKRLEAVLEAVHKLSGT